METLPDDNTASVSYENSVGDQQEEPTNPPDDSSAEAGNLQIQDPSISHQIENKSAITIIGHENIDLTLSEDISDDDDVEMIYEEPIMSDHYISDCESATTSQGRNKKMDVADETKKRQEAYNRSLRFLRQIESKDPTSLTTYDKRLIRKHNNHVMKHESRLKTNKMGSKCDEDRDTTLLIDRGRHQHNPGAKKNHSQKSTFVPEISSSTIKRKEKSDTANSLTVDSNRKTEHDAKIKRRDLEATISPSAKSLSSEKRQLFNEAKASTLPSTSELQVAVLDWSNPFGKFSTERWLMIEEKILRSLSESVGQDEDDSFAEFNANKWQKGIKVINCGNKKAVEFLTTCINGLENLWNDMEIEIVRFDEIPTTVKVSLPPPALEDEATMKLLKAQNKRLLAQDWKFIKGQAADKEGGKDVWIRVGPESLRRIKQSHGVIKFGLSHIKVVVPDEEPNQPDT